MQIVDKKFNVHSFLYHGINRRLLHNTDFILRASWISGHIRNCSWKLLCRKISRNSLISSFRCRSGDLREINWWKNFGWLLFDPCQYWSSWCYFLSNIIVTFRWFNWNNVLVLGIMYSTLIVNNYKLIKLRIHIVHCIIIYIIH